MENILFAVNVASLTIGVILVWRALRAYYQGNYAQSAALTAFAVLVIQ